MGASQACPFIADNTMLAIKPAPRMRGWRQVFRDTARDAVVFASNVGEGPLLKNLVVGPRRPLARFARNVDGFPREDEAEQGSALSGHVVFSIIVNGSCSTHRVGAPHGCCPRDESHAGRAWAVVPDA